MLVTLFFMVVLANLIPDISISYWNVINLLKALIFVLATTVH